MIISCIQNNEHERHFSYDIIVLDLRCISVRRSSWWACVHVCLCKCLCVLANVCMWQQCWRSHWLLKVAFLHQARPFNQVPLIRQLCPHSKQPLWLTGELQHPAGVGRGQLALGDQTKLLLPRQREFAFVCLFEKQTEIERLEETQFGCWDSYKPEKVSLHTCTFKSVAWVCLWFCIFTTWVSSWQRGDNRSLENGDGDVNRQANSLSVLMRKSAVPKRMVGAGSICTPDSWSYIKTNIHKRTTHVDTHKQHRHTSVRTGTRAHAGSGGRAKSDSLLGSRANFKGVSIFRPEQLDPAKMDQAHQSPACAGCPEYNGLAGCFWWA